MVFILKFSLKNENETRALAQQFADCISNKKRAWVIYLEGDLGAGKTTFARHFIQYFGFDRVKSPTYSLVESYENAAVSIHHFDCYRLGDAQELELIGVRDYATARSIQLIEWAERGAGAIPNADFIIQISGEDEARIFELNSQNPAAEHLLKCLN